MTDDRSAGNGNCEEDAMSLLPIILIILGGVALSGGGWGYGRYGAVDP